ncbi:MAG: sugar ABC transporter substrate-binding protein [Pleomorphochaeta sp.]
MKKLGKVLMVFALVLMLVPVQVFANGAGEQKADDGKQTVAVVLKTLSSEYWKRVESGCDDAAAELGINLIKLGPPTEDAVEQQINMVEDALTQNPVALVFSPSQPSTAVNVVNKAKDMGVPVVLVDTPMPEGFTNYDSYVGTENFQAGIQGAESLIASMNGKKDVNVVLIEGAPGNPTCTTRADGAQQAFVAAGYNIISRQPGYSDREKAYNVMQNVLQTSSDIDIVFCANDEMALGAVRATKQAGVDAKIMGVDGNKSALESILAGELYSTIAQRPENMGYLAVKYAMEAVSGKTIDKYVDAGVDIYTKENAQGALDALN